MVKKQSFVVLVTLMSIIGSAFGLGLGDIEVKSNLNDPLEAEIKLLQLQGLNAGEVLPTLASNDDFRRAGIERSFFLANIQFRVKEKESGELVVTLVTRQAVREPFLNFLVEVNWPGGRLLKEYTVLLDPPVFDTGLAVDALVVESSNTPGATDLVTTTVIEEGAVTENVTVSEPITPRDDSLPAGQYRVKRNDTLWEIALKVPDGSGYTPQQVMLAIQDLNPEAFLNSNINRVKAGSVLTLPDDRQIATRSLDEAIAEVKAQNSGAAPKLRSPVSDSSEVQLSATDSTSSALPTGEAEKNPDGYLELTADSESNTTTASGETTAVIDQLQNQLSTAEELNDQFERERDELESRVSELQDQIEIMERLLDIQNSDLAQVQQALVQTDAANDNIAATADDVATDDTAVDTASDTATTTDAVEPTPVEPTPIEATPTPTPTPSVTPAPVATGPDGIMGMVSEYVRKVTDWVMGSVTNMAISGLALLLLIVLPLYIRSRRSGSDQTLGEMTESLDEYEETEEYETELDDDLLAEVEDDFEEEAEDEPETLDAVVEAEMYMAYQKYDQAEEKLKEAFSEHPDRTDVGMKLLEVYAETGDANAFTDLESRLAFSVDQQAEVTNLRAKLPVGATDQGDDLDSDMMSGDLNLDLDVGGEETDVSSIGSDLDFDLDLDTNSDDEGSLDFNMEPESNLTEESAEPEVELDIGSATDSFEVEETEELSTDLDFSLDLGDLDEETDTGTSSDLDFSLDGLEDDEPLQLDTAVEPVADAEEDLSSLDFSLELEDESSSLELDSVDEASIELESDDTSLDIGLDLDSTTEESIDAELGNLTDELGGESDGDILLDLDSTESAEIDLDVELGSFGETPELSVDEDIALDISDADSSLEGLSEPEIDLDIDMDSSDPLQQLTDSLDSDAELEEDEFDFLSGNDEASTKLDLARAYIEMDDKDGARDILEEVATEGNDDQKVQARELMEQL